MLERGRWDDALRYADALETYTAGEPLPWSEVFIERARALASLAGKTPDAALRIKLQSLLSTLDEVGLVAYREPLVAALRRNSFLA